MYFVCVCVCVCVWGGGVGLKKTRISKNAHSNVLPHKPCALTSSRAPPSLPPPPHTLSLKDTTLADYKVAYLDRQIEIRDRQLVISLYDKRDHFPFAVHNYPHLDSNVPCMPTYGVYISQLIRFAKACDTYPVTSA